MSNMREIANKAGVGIATVSRYINKSGYVGEKSRIKIRKAIEELNYKPNALAKALFTKRSNIIGLILPNINNPFFPEIAKAVEKHAYDKGYRIFLCDTDGNARKEKTYIHTLLENRVDGIIVARGQCESEYQDIDIPVISIDKELSKHIPNVESDNKKGAILAVNHLIEQGCKNILHIAGPKDIKTANDRIVGVKEVSKLREVNIDIINANDMERILTDINEVNRYDGIFAWNDMVAMEVLRYVSKLNLDVPRDLKVIGFDNIYVSSLVTPALTTVEQSIYKIGTKAIKLLLESIENQEKVENKSYIIPVNVIKREST